MGIGACRSCHTGGMCWCARQRRTAALLRTVLRTVVPAVFPLSDFPLLGRSFAEVSELIEAIQWKPIHMCKYLRVRTSSGLENLKILASTEETLLISCCWNTHFPQSLWRTPCCWERRILSIREQPGRVNTQCLFCLKQFAEGERLQQRRSGALEATWRVCRVAARNSCPIPAALLPSCGGLFHESGVKRLAAWGRRGRLFEMPELCLVKTGKHPSG